MTSTGRSWASDRPSTCRRHDPPPRLADLVRTSEPTCCFPGCRVRARDCDLDHRVPYDPQDPDGRRGGGSTCSSNLQPLCRTHHRLKTAGVIHVRLVPTTEGRGVPPGTLEFTTSTGLAYRRSPTRATPSTIDLEDPLVATAVAHAGLRAAQGAASDARGDLAAAAASRRSAGRPGAASAAARAARVRRRGPRLAEEPARARATPRSRGRGPSLQPGGRAP